MRFGRDDSFGVGFWIVLLVTMVTLKLAGVINWPWWAALAPIWGPALFVLGVGLLAVLIEAVMAEPR